MNNKATLCLLLLICSMFALLEAQTSYLRSIPIEVPQGLDTPIFTPKAIFPCQDNSVVVVGEVQAMSDIQMLYSTCVVKIDAYGNKVWQSFASHGAFSPFNVTGISIDSLENVYYIMEIYSGIEIYKTDRNGNSTSVSGQQHGFMYLWKINRAIRLPNNEIVAVGYAWVPNPNIGNEIKNIAFLRMSATGDSLAYRLYPPDVNNTLDGADAFDMDINNEGLPVATCDISDGVLSVIIFDLSGNILQQYDMYCMPESYYRYLISQNHAGSGMIIGYKNSSGYNLVRFDNSIDSLYTFTGDLYFDSMFIVNNKLIASVNNVYVLQTIINCCRLLTKDY